MIKTSISKNTTCDTSRLIKFARCLDRPVVSQFLALLCFTMATVLMVIHMTILYEHWQYGHSLWMTDTQSSLLTTDTSYRSRLISKYPHLGADNLNSLLKYGFVKVNTSIFVK